MKKSNRRAAVSSFCLHSQFVFAAHVSAFVFTNKHERGEKRANRTTKAKKQTEREKIKKKQKKNEAPPYSIHRLWTHIQPRNVSKSNINKQKTQRRWRTTSADDAQPDAQNLGIRVNDKKEKTKKKIKKKAKKKTAVRLPHPATATHAQPREKVSNDSTNHHPSAQDVPRVHW